MSSYGRVQEAIDNVLDAFGIDSEQTTDKWWVRDDDGEKRLVTLSEALADAAYETAFDMGRRVALARLESALKDIIIPKDDETQGR